MARKWKEETEELTMPTKEHQNTPRSSRLEHHDQATPSLALLDHPEFGDALLVCESQ
jgi:hypothetical protein